MNLTPEELNIAIKRFNYHIGYNKPEKDCWPWLGVQQKNTKFAYAMITIRPNQIISAHRFSYMIHKGEIPPGYVVRHKCDNPRCVNPDHLELGTQRENILDHVEREPNERIKLNPECVKVIKWLLKENDKKAFPDKQLIKKLAAFHKVSIITIYQINHGLTWKQVTI